MSGVWGRRPRIARAGVLIGILAVVGLAACGSPTMKATAAVCTPTTDAVLKNIGSKLQVDGALRNSRTVSRGGMNFISAELHKADDKPNAKGDLLTWAVTGTGSNDFVAVDVHAREDTGWPHAQFDVRKDGAMLSRACADEIRGQVPCPGQSSTVTVPKGFRTNNKNRCNGSFSLGNN